MKTTKELIRKTARELFNARGYRLYPCATSPTPWTSAWAT